MQRKFNINIKYTDEVLDRLMDTVFINKIRSCTISKSFRLSWSVRYSRQN